MKLLPFEFERINKNHVFISNIGGFFSVISNQELIELIKTNSLHNKEKERELTQKCFLCRSEDYKVSKNILCAAFGKRIRINTEFDPAFIIIPTLRCDHSCKYCQVSRAPKEKKGYDISKADLESAINIISRLGSTPYTIEIQGGEPLLRFDLIKHLYSKCDDILGIQNFNIIIASSLSLLTEEILTWAKERNVEFSISLDGKKRTHDKNRILPNKSSFELVERGIRLIQKKLGKHRLGVVTTATKETLKNPRHLLDAHLDLELHQLFVRPVSPYGFSEKTHNIPSLDDYFIFYEELLNHIKKEWLQGRKIEEYSLKVHARRILNPSFSKYSDLKSPSGFALNSIVFNYDGKIYGSDESRMLQRTHPDIDFSIGNINKGTLNISKLNKSIIEGGINLNKPGCSTCALQPFCGSDPLQNISIFGEPIGDKSLSYFCEYHKNMFHIAINLLYGTPQNRDFIMEMAK